MFDISSRLIWKLTKLAVKISVILAIIFGILFWVLSALGGDSDTLKSALEEFVQERAPGYEVEIGTLNKMSFFPHIGFDVADIQVLGADAQPVFGMEKGQAAISFLDVALGTGRLSSFHLQNLVARAGTLHAQRIYLQQVAILEREGAAFFEGYGTLGPHDFKFSLPMKKHGGRYEFPRERAFELYADTIKISGTLTAAAQQEAQIENLEISSDDVNLSGAAVLSGEDIWRVEGALLGEYGAAERGMVEGAVTIHGSNNIEGQLILSGFENAAPVQAMLRDLFAFWLGPDTIMPDNLIQVQN